MAPRANPTAARGLRASATKSPAAKPKKPTADGRARECHDRQWSTRDWLLGGEFELSRRRDNLSWSHHREVGGLEPDQQDELLDKAESEDWSIRDMRRAGPGAEGRETSRAARNSQSQVAIGINRNHRPPMAYARVTRSACSLA